MRTVLPNWGDESQEIWLTAPNILVRAADLAVSRFNKDGDLHNQIGTRRCFYDHPVEGRVVMELTPYVHPTGAATITLGTVATAADGSQTFTPTNEGRFLMETGVLLTAGAVAQDVNVIAGGLLTDYYTHFDGDVNGTYGGLETGRAITIEAGDMLWLVRNGEYEADFSAAVTDGDPVVSSTGTAGEVRAAVAYDLTNTTTLLATLHEREIGRGHKCLGWAAETLGGAGLGFMDLELPPRRYHSTT